MKRHLRAAICRINVMPDGADAKSLSRGTGFLVAPDIVLTALHVVADRKTDPPTPFPGAIQLDFPDHQTAAVMHAPYWDCKDDWVLLRCPVPLPIAPLALSTPREGSTDWLTFGFPDANPRDGMVQTGSVENFNGTLDGAPVYQLLSRQAAAGRGAPSRGLSGGPVIVGQQVIGLLRFALMKEGETVAGTLYGCPVERAVQRCPTLLQLQPPEPPPGSDSPENLALSQPLVSSSPYRGLKRFNEKDRDLFFGRDQLIAKLLAQLQSSNLLLVLGASGSGKSSVVRAGLLPRWRDGDRNRRISFTFEPDKNPFQSFRSALQAGDIKADQVGDLLEGQPEGPVKLLQSLRQPGEQWILFVDQFEEVFTLCDERLRMPFLEALLAIARDPTGATRLVLAMRGDFMDRFSAFPEFAKLAEKNISFVANLQADELRHAIEQPAARHGVVFESGLVEEISKDVQGQAGSLPLLQYTLDLLWQEEAKRDGLADRHLNTVAYRQLGGVRGALQERAEQIYAGLADGTGAKSESPRQRIVRQIFLRLVSISGENASAAGSRPVRCRAPIGEFTGGPNEAVLGELIKKTLLVSSGKQGETAMVEVAHEALFAAWERLAGWINDSRQAIFAKDRLVPDAQRWHELQLRNAELAEAELLGGTRLDQALEMRDRGDFDAMLGGLPPTTVQFLAASVAHRDHLKLREKRRRKRLQVISGFAVACAAVAVVMAYLSSRNAAKAAANEITANKNAVEAKASEKKATDLLREASRSDFANAQARLDQGFWQQAVVLLGRALRYDEKNRHARDALWLALAFGQRDGAMWPILELTSASLDAVGASFSPDGTRIVTRSRSVAQAWDAASGRLLTAPLPGKLDFPTTAITPDGTRIVAEEDHNNAQVREADTGKPIGGPLRLGEHLRGAKFSPHGALLVTVDARGAQLWDAATARALGDPLPHGANTEPAFSPDGAKLVTLGSDHVARLWNSARGMALGDPMPHDAEVRQVIFSLDGALLATLSADRKVSVWDATTGRLRREITVQDEDFVCIAFSPDGTLIATGADNGLARLWSVETGQPIGRPAVHREAVQIAFSPDGTRVITASGAIVRIWDALLDRLGAFIQVDRRVNSACFSPDGTRILTAEFLGPVQVWSAATGQPLGVPLPHQDRVIHADFHPDGSRVVTLTGDTALLWDAVSGQSLVPMQNQEPLRFSRFSPDASQLLLLSEKGAQVWTVATSKPFGPHRKFEKPILEGWLSSNGARLITISDDTHDVWDAASGKLRGSRKDDPIAKQAGLNSDGTRAFSLSYEKIEVWQVEGAKLLGPPIPNEQRFTQARFHPDGLHLTLLSSDKAQVFDIASGKATGIPFLRKDAADPSDALENDSRRAEIDAYDTQILASDPAERSGDKAAPFIPVGPSLPTSIRTLFSPDGTRIATASGDRTARIWDIVPRQTLDGTIAEQLATLAARTTIDQTTAGYSKMPREIRQALWQKLEPALASAPDWLFLARQLRSPSPASPISARSSMTIREAATRLIQTANPVCLREALSIDPGHPLIQLALAAPEENPVRSSFLRQYGVSHLPADASICRQAAGMLLAQKDKTRATAALEKAVKLDSNSTELPALKKALEDLK